MPKKEPQISFSGYFQASYLKSMGGKRHVLKLMGAMEPMEPMAPVLTEPLEAHLPPSRMAYKTFLPEKIGLLGLRASIVDFGF